MINCLARNEGEPLCKNDFFIKVKVRVHHNISNKITWQSWNFCEEHFKQFTIDMEEGRNWERWYKNSDRVAHAIDYKVPSILI